MAKGFASYAEGTIKMGCNSLLFIFSDFSLPPSPPPLVLHVYISSLLGGAVHTMLLALLENILGDGV